jgi:hypothetical protein
MTIRNALILDSLLFKQVFSKKSHDIDPNGYPIQFSESNQYSEITSFREFL